MFFKNSVDSEGWKYTSAKEKGAFTDIVYDVQLHFSSLNTSSLLLSSSVSKKCKLPDPNLHFLLHVS